MYIHIITVLIIIILSFLHLFEITTMVMFNNWLQTGLLFVRQNSL